jgi:hypothetical protein
VIGGGNHIFERDCLKEKEVGFRHTMGYTCIEIREGETYAISYMWKGEQVSHIMKVFVKCSSV